MSAELIQIFRSLNQKELNTQLALQCAPLLTGNKASNLFIVPVADKIKVIKMFAGTSISIYVLYQTKEKVTFLLYRKQKLVFNLQDLEVRNLLIQLGYQEFVLENILKILKMKYKAHMVLKKEFPHELGILLEYPVMDVCSFMEKQGKDCLYVGYWKVYSNLETALTIFEKYDRAKEEVLRLVAQGTGMIQILEKYDIQVSKIQKEAV